MDSGRSETPSATSREAVASKIMEQVGRKSESEGPRTLGDSLLLEFNMSDAAARYGVAANVIPHRIRKGEAEKTNV